MASRLRAQGETLSGWIKLEKDLREDQRVKRMAKALQQSKTFCNAPSLLCVTVVLGGLAQLWMHADSFARDDDILDVRAEEIDEITGIEGFSQLLPTDWLEVIDAERVKLPGFQQHNGPAAKQRALTGKRVTHHRNKEKRETVTTCDPPVTHDRYQTRPDQTRQEETKQEVEREVRAPRSPTATRLPPDFSLNPERRAIAEAEKADAEREFAAFTDYWRSVSGARARKHDWDATWRNWCRRAGDFKPRVNGNGVARKPFTPAPTTAELEAQEAARGSG